MCPTPRGSQETTSKFPRKCSVNNGAFTATIWTPDPPGPPVRVGRWWKKAKGWMEWLTRVKKDGTQLVPSRSQLDHREACISSRAIVIIHRNFQVPALQVGIRSVRAKALTAPPGNLQCTQKGRKGNGRRGRTHRRIAASCESGGGDDAADE